MSFQHHLSRKLLLPGILAFFTGHSNFGEPPRLTAPFVHPNRAVDLVLLGDTGAAYTIEASLDLSNWFLVSTGLAVNGQFSVTHNAASNYATLFYRGKGTGNLLP